MLTVPRTLVSGFVALGLAACTSASNVPPAASNVPVYPISANDRCHAVRVADVVGQPYNDALLTRVRNAVGHETIRPIQSGQPVTLDFREERLNIEIGTDGKVDRVFCG